jgi:phosphate transport system ATP-binding protein
MKGREFPMDEVILRCENLHTYFGDQEILKGINLSIMENKITAIMGPSGCGKSTLIRCLNRMNDLIPTFRLSGKVFFRDLDLYDPRTSPQMVRMRIGMVFQKPNPFPKSIYDNVAYGPRIQGIRDCEKLDEIVERFLKQSALWDEVKDRLKHNALELSGGQQQRLCIARALAANPNVLLLDEPCSALDPIATAKIEDLMQSLKESYTLVIVTHNMQQAARVSDYTAFLYMGELLEYGPTEEIFTNPKNPKTQDYITGRFG